MKQSNFAILFWPLSISFLVSGCNELATAPDNFTLSETHDAFTNTSRFEASKTFINDGWPLELAFICERKSQLKNGVLTIVAKIEDKNWKSDEDQAVINHIFAKFDNDEPTELAITDQGALTLPASIIDNIYNYKHSKFYIRINFGYGPGGALDRMLKLSGNTPPRSPQITSDASVDLRNSVIRRVTNECRERH